MIVSRFSCAFSTSSFDASPSLKPVCTIDENLAVDVLLLLQRVNVEVGLAQLEIVRRDTRRDRDALAGKLRIR